MRPPPDPAPPAPAGETNILTETQVDHLPKRKGEVGMRISPEVVLFVGAAVLTVALVALYLPFMVRAWRTDSALRRGRGPGDGGAR